MDYLVAPLGCWTPGSLISLKNLYCVQSTLLFPFYNRKLGGLRDFSTCWQKVVRPNQEQTLGALALSRSF